MRAFQDCSRPASQVYYTVAGRSLLVQCYDQRLANLIESLFEAWFLTPVTLFPQPPDVTITFNAPETLPQIPSGLEHFNVADSGDCYTDGNTCYADLSNSLMLLHQDKAVNVSLWIKHCSEFPDAQLTQSTSFAVAAALRRCGLFDLHAAGVVTPDRSKAALIIGPSSSGKSTLTLQLMAAGWGYLSDDVVFLSRAGAEVEARGFRRFFAVTENTVLPQVLGALPNAISPAARIAKPKRRFEPQNFFPSTYVPMSIPRLLFFSSRSGESETGIDELSQVQTMKRLITSCPWATYEKAMAPENLSVLSQLARQCKAFDLFAGTDLLRPDYASALLSTYIKD